jgi:cytochrome b subunit of formate dehydrogenase
MENIPSVGSVKAEFATMRRREVIATSDIPIRSYNAGQKLLFYDKYLLVFALHKVFLTGITLQKFIILKILNSQAIAQDASLVVRLLFVELANFY